MANTLKFGNSEWYGSEGNILAYNDLGGNFKPLPFTLSRGSSATRVNQQGLIETVGANDARVDYLDNAKGALLLEPQRTNLIPYSQDFSNASWIKTGSATITTNTTISPDGTQNADTLSLLVGNYFYESISSGAGTFTISCYVRVTSGTLDFKMQSFTPSVGANASSVFTANTEWQRFEFTTTVTANSNFYPVFIDAPLTGGVFEIWGAQLEQGSYATSYIPTSGSTVTRVQDVCTNGGNAQVINSTEGVLYVEIKNDIIQQQTISLFESNNNQNSVQLGFINGNIRCAIGRSNQYVLGTVSPAFNYANGQINKYAIVWNGTSAKTFINGQLKNTITTPSPLNLKLLAMTNPLGNENMSGNIEDLRVYNTALSDSELAALTQV